MSDSNPTTISHETHLIVNPTRKEIARFMGNVFINHEKLFNRTPCWEWIGNISDKGYGRTTYHKKLEMTHRWMSAWVFSPLCRGIRRDRPQVDHLCRNRRCCSPVHLEIVTPKMNVRRGTSPVAGNAQKTKGNCGHDYANGNLIVENGGGRRCRKCHNERSLKRYYDKKMRCTN